MKTQEIFSVNKDNFQEKALEVFRYQWENVSVYREFCDLMKKNPKNVNTLQQIPFLPIEFFKSRVILSRHYTPCQYFQSSGTTGENVSKHYVGDMSLYKESFTRGFELFYGDVRDYTIFALLPSYLERKGSSLVYMVDDLITRTQKKQSGFYLKNTKELKDKLIEADKNGKVLLIGVSFALLEMAQDYKFELKNTIVMETGGMKGRRKEIVREELHHILKKGFAVEQIHSEYGMTELFSQGYSKKNGEFETVPWMKILIRDPQDALQMQKKGKSGGVNVIDLANVNSCSFIATQDLGVEKKEGVFEILGRFDTSDTRGCNLMVMD